MPWDTSATELNSNTTTALNVAAREPAIVLWGKWNKCASKVAQGCLWTAQSSPELSCETWHRASYSSFVHSCPCPVLSLTVDIIFPPPPMPAHLPQSPSSFLCILVFPHTPSPSLSCSPVPDTPTSLQGIKFLVKSTPWHLILKADHQWRVRSFN